MGTVKPLKEITQKSAFPHQLYVCVFLSKLSSYQSHLNLVEHVSICRPSQSNNKFPCLFPERQRYWNKLQNNSGLTNSSLSQRKNHLVFFCCHVNRNANIPLRLVPEVYVGWWIWNTRTNRKMRRCRATLLCTDSNCHGRDVRLITCDKTDGHRWPPSQHGDVWLQHIS